MPKLNSTLASLIVAAAATATTALLIEHFRMPKQGERRVSTAIAAAVKAPKPTWSASAPGRVEPRNGEVRIGAQMPGKVAQVLVGMNDAVRAGDLLVRLADDEPIAKFAAATAEVSVRRRERDGETVPRIANDRRVAEDALSNAERALHRARMEFDQLQSTASNGKVTPEAIAAARTAITEASEKVETERANVRRVQALQGMPLPTRLESALAQARAELALVEAAIERTRIRAPSDGNVLQINTRAGETVSPSPEDVLVVFGDLSVLRVRAEIEERDIAQIRVGQPVMVRSDTYPGKEFTGTVERMAKALGLQRFAPKGPRRQTEVDVLQVLINLDAATPLLPGMRVDVFFKPDEAGGKSAAVDAKTN